MKLGNYYVSWRYQYDDNILQANTIPISVVCYIETADETAYSEITRAQASCHPFDNFSKEIGRKLSLARALANLKLDKSERTQIWKDYFNRKKS